MYVIWGAYIVCFQILICKQGCLFCLFSAKYLFDEACVSQEFHVPLLIYLKLEWNVMVVYIWRKTSLYWSFFIISTFSASGEYLKGKNNAYLYYFKLNPQFLFQAWRRKHSLMLPNFGTMRKSRWHHQRCQIGLPSRRALWVWKMRP